MSIFQVAFFLLILFLTSLDGSHNWNSKLTPKTIHTLSTNSQSIQVSSFIPYTEYHCSSYSKMASFQRKPPPSVASSSSKKKMKQKQSSSTVNELITSPVNKDNASHDGTRQEVFNSPKNIPFNTLNVTTRMISMPFGTIKESTRL